MNVKELLKSLAVATKMWRERAIRNLEENSCTDLAYRPRSGMSSLGWLLTHQAAAYDYTLNMLIKNNPPKRPDLFYLYRGDSSDSGDWVGTSLQEINDYFTAAQDDLLSWFEQASDDDLNRILEGPDVPQYYNGMRVIDAIADTFAHLNHHNGHLSAIKGDWCQQNEK